MQDLKSLIFTLNGDLCNGVRHRRFCVIFNFNSRFAWTVVRASRKLEKRERNRLLLSVTLVRMLILKVFIQLVLRRKSFRATRNITREVSALIMSLHVPFQLRFIIEKRWAQATGVVTSWCNLRFDSNSMSAEVVIELCDCVKLFRALTADILLNLMMCLHVIVEIRNLGK